jgi:hypothetical protein
MKRRQNYLVVKYPPFDIHNFLFYNIVCNQDIVWQTESLTKTKCMHNTLMEKRIRKNTGMNEEGRNKDGNEGRQA